MSIHASTCNNVDIGPLLEQADGAFQEAVQTLALEHVVAQQGDVDELMHAVLAGSIGHNDVFLLLAQLVQVLLVVLEVFFLVLGQFLVVLLQGLELGIQGFLGQIDNLLDERMLGVEHQAVHVGHLAIEAHAGLESGHFLHAAHVFGLGDDHGLVVG